MHVKACSFSGTERNFFFPGFVFSVKITKLLTESEEVEVELGI